MRPRASCAHPGPSPILTVKFRHEKVYLSKTVLRQAFRPVEEGCECYTCRHHTLAYLHHLFKAHEPAAGVLSTVHNLHVMAEKMRRLRERIANDEV